MSAFSEVETRKPPSFALVAPAAFADTWSDKPREPVAIGLRLIADSDLHAARAQAAARANTAHPDVDLQESDLFNAQLWADSYHCALMAWIVARGMCDPNDVSLPWKPFEAAPEDMARDCLSANGVGFIFDAWERMRIASDPTQREADAGELDELVGLMQERLPHALRVRAIRVRRLLAFCLDELRLVVVPDGVVAPGAVEAPPTTTST